METKDCFKNILVLLVKLLGIFKHSEQHEEDLKQRERQLEFLELKKSTKRRKFVNSNEKFSLVADQWFMYYKSLNEQKVSTYDKRSELVGALNRWLGEKKLIDLTPDF